MWKFNISECGNMNKMLTVGWAIIVYYLPLLRTGINTVLNFILYEYYL